MSSVRRVLVCGGREFTDFRLILSVLSRLSPSLVIEGGARGADTGARVAAGRLGIPVREFPADWARFGRRAGYLRNEQMLAEGHPDMVLAFPGGPGTASMVRLARQAGVPVILIAPAQPFFEKKVAKKLYKEVSRVSSLVSLSTSSARSLWPA